MRVLRLSGGTWCPTSVPGTGRSSQRRAQERSAKAPRPSVRSRWSLDRVESDVKGADADFRESSAAPSNAPSPAQESTTLAPGPVATHGRASTSYGWCRSVNPLFCGCFAAPIRSEL